MGLYMCFWSSLCGLDCHAKYFRFYFIHKGSLSFYREERHDITYVLKIKAAGGRGASVLKNKRLKVKRQVIQIIKERIWEKMNLVYSNILLEVYDKSDKKFGRA